MFRRAVRAEFFKSIRCAPLMFFGFVFVPLCSLLLGLLLQINSLSVPGVAQVDLAARLARELAISASPLAQLFFIAAAALIFGGEYGAETWRLMAPRARRMDLIWAKITLYAAAVGASLLLLLLSACCCAVVASVKLRAPVLWQWPDGSPACAVTLQFGVSWLELLVAGLLAGCVTMASRSALVGAVSGILLAFCQALLAASLSMRNASWLAFAGLPAFSFEVMRFFVLHRAFAPQRYVTPLEALKALLSLAAWLSASVCVLQFKFRNQELSRE
jgi:ABC-type transport system involved in multi-copper enzyme maturation permease subunit